MNTTETQSGSHPAGSAATWTILRYKRNAIPNYGWRVMQGTLVIMGDLEKEAARQLAEDHNRCLSPNAEVSEVAVADSTKTSGIRQPLSLD